MPPNLLRQMRFSLAGYEEGKLSKLKTIKLVFAQRKENRNTTVIHILPVLSQILCLSKPFISCYFVMSSEGLWACCLLLIGYKDGSFLRENLNFLISNARGYFGLGDLLHLLSKAWMYQRCLVFLLKYHSS